MYGRDAGVENRKYELSVLVASAVNDWVSLLQVSSYALSDRMRAFDVVQPFSALAETASLGLSHANRPQPI